MDVERDPKRLRISIEPHTEKKIYSTTPEGKENVIVEPSPAEKFARLIRQIDFQHHINEKQKKQKPQENAESSSERERKETLKDEDKASSSSSQSLPENGKKKESTQQQPQTWPWASVAEQLYHARLEVDQILSLVNTLQSNQKTISIWNITKSQPSLTYYNVDLALRELNKKKELKTAASILSQGAQTLKKIVTTEKAYFDDLLQIRRHWLLMAKPITGSKKAPQGTRPTGKLFVDYSHRSAGSTIRMEAELIQTSSGKVSLIFPAAMNKRLRIFSDSSSTNDNQHHISSDDSNSQNCVNQLWQAHRSQFETELFQQLTKDALTKRSSSVQVIENDIKIESDINTTLTIQLKSVTSSDTSSSVNDIMMISENSQNNENKDLSYPVIEIALYQLHRRNFVKNLFGFEMNINNISLAEREKGKLTNAPLTKKIHYRMLDQVVLLYRHFSFVREVNRVLNGITAVLPLAHVHWYTCSSPKKPFLSAFEFQFGKSFSVDVTIDRVYVRFSTGASSDRAVLTAKELGHFLVVQVVQYLVLSVHNYTLSLGYRSSRHDTMSFSVSTPNGPLAITFDIDDDFTLRVHRANVTGRTPSQVPAVLWADIPGETIEDKIQQLLAPLTSSQNKGNSQNSAPRTLMRTLTSRSSDDMSDDGMHDQADGEKRKGKQVQDSFQGNHHKMHIADGPLGKMNGGNKDKLSKIKEETISSAPSTSLLNFSTNGIH